MNDEPNAGAESEVASPESVQEVKVKQQLQGTVTRLELYGAFIDLGLETEAVIHISQIGKEHVKRVADVLSVGDQVSVWVERIDPARNQVMVTMIEPLAVEWTDLQKGNAYTGRVTRLEDFGAFIDIGAEREGLVHVSELSHDYVKHPSEAISVGDEVQVQLLGFSRKKRRIDLSIKALLDDPESENGHPGGSFEDVADLEDDELEELPTAMEIALRRAMGDSFKPRLRKKSKNRRRRRRKMRAQQNDILNRTLQTSDEN